MSGLSMPRGESLPCFLHVACVCWHTVQAAISCAVPVCTDHNSPRQHGSSFSVRDYELWVFAWTGTFHARHLSTNHWCTAGHRPFLSFLLSTSTVAVRLASGSCTDSQVCSCAWVTNHMASYRKNDQERTLSHQRQKCSKERWECDSEVGCEEKIWERQRQSSNRRRPRPAWNDGLDHTEEGSQIQTIKKQSLSNIFSFSYPRMESCLW